jgi:anthraniloyl-CoA monooxygenase
MTTARRILCIGGGAAGLYFALLAKKADPSRTVRVVERNRPYDTFGWGVVFSDQTLGNLEAADAKTARVPKRSAIHPLMGMKTARLRV